MTTPQKYTNISILLHWLMALLILILFCLGWYMEDLPKGSDERSYFFALHKSIGLTVFLILLVRVVWALTHRAPPMPLSLTKWQRIVATTTHHSLYLLMFLQPLTGYLSSSFSGYKTKFWNIITLPQWAEKNKEMNELLTEVHEISSILLATCIVLHILGAFSYLFLRHENVLSRMLPGKR